MLPSISGLFLKAGFVSVAGRFEDPRPALVGAGLRRPRWREILRTALVVDDSMLIRHTVCRFLEEHGFAVESASNGWEAMQALESLRPHLIVTDLVMPRMTGSELITLLKARPETAAIPIVVLAGRSDDQQMPREQRADFLIFKDIDIVEQLSKTLELALPA